MPAVVQRDRNGLGRATRSAVESNRAGVGIVRYPRPNSLYRGRKGVCAVTTRANFADDEWDLVVELPRWVVAAASAAQHDLTYRTNHEVEAGFVASAHGRDTGNAFVTEVANACMRIFDNRGVIAGTDFTDRDAAIDSVLAKVGAVNRLVTAKADAEDVAAYRKWLVSITDVVISAARSGDILGFGGRLVTASEHSFRDRLVLTLQR